MKIKENYVPLAAVKGANKLEAQMAICPNCKQQIPYDELDAHMRSKSPIHRPMRHFTDHYVVELLDPRWKEQKAKAESHQDRLGRVVANVSFAFCLPILRLRSRIRPCTLRCASELLSLALRRPSKLICLLLYGLMDIFYFSAGCFFEIASGGS